MDRLLDALAGFEGVTSGSLSPAEVERRINAVVEALEDAEDSGEPTEPGLLEATRTEIRRAQRWARANVPGWEG